MATNAFIAGALAGWCEACATMPLDSVKTQLQLSNQRNSFFRVASDIHALKGVRGFYYGLPAVMTQVSMKAGIRFSAFERCKSALHGYASEGVVHWISGTLAGITEAVIWVTPTDRLKVLRNNEIRNPQPRFTTLRQSFTSVIREQGMTGLFVGCVPTAARNGTSVGLRFFVVQKILHVLTGGKGEPKTWQRLFAGFFAGSTVICITIPFDVLKSRMQKRTDFPSLRVVFQDTLKHEGARAFYKGLSAACLKIGTGQAIIFAVYGKINAALKNR